MQSVLRLFTKSRTSEQTIQSHHGSCSRALMSKGLCVSQSVKWPGPLLLMASCHEHSLNQGGLERRTQQPPPLTDASTFSLTALTNLVIQLHDVTAGFNTDMGAQDFNI